MSIFHTEQVHFQMKDSMDNTEEPNITWEGPRNFQDYTRTEVIFVENLMILIWLYNSQGSKSMQDVSIVYSESLKKTRTHRILLRMTYPLLSNIDNFDEIIIPDASANEIKIVLDIAESG